MLPHLRRLAEILGSMEPGPTVAVAVINQREMGLALAQPCPSNRLDRAHRYRPTGIHGIFRFRPARVAAKEKANGESGGTSHAEELSPEAAERQKSRRS